MIAVLAVVCGGQAYAGGLEGERLTSGVRFGESVITDEAPAVRMSGDFRAAPKAALTANIRKESSIPASVRGVDGVSAAHEPSVIASSAGIAAGVAALFGTIIGLSFAGVPIIVATVAAFIACVFVASMVARIAGRFLKESK